MIKMKYLNYAFACRGSRLVEVTRLARRNSCGGTNAGFATVHRKVAICLRKPPCSSLVETIKEVKRPYLKVRTFYLVGVFITQVKNAGIKAVYHKDFVRSIIHY